MLKLRIAEILEEKQLSKYYLFKALEPMSYQNFNRIYLNQTSSISFDNLLKIKKALNVSFDELFVEVTTTDIQE